MGWEGSVQKWRNLSKVPVSVFSIPIPASSTQFRNYFSFLERTTRHLASLSADIFFFFTNVDVSKIDLHLQSPPSASMASGSFSQLDPMKSLRQAPSVLPTVRDHTGSWIWTGVERNLHSLPDPTDVSVHGHS